MTKGSKLRIRAAHRANHRETERLKSLNARLTALKLENARLRQSLAEVAKERDEYLNSLYAQLKKAVTQDDLLEFERSIREDTWLPFKQAIQQLEKLRKKGPGA